MGHSTSRLTSCWRANRKSDWDLDPWDQSEVQEQQHFIQWDPIVKVEGKELDGWNTAKRLESQKYVTKVKVTCGEEKKPVVSYETDPTRRSSETDPNVLLNEADQPTDSTSGIDLGKGMQYNIEFVLSDSGISCDHSATEFAGEETGLLSDCRSDEKDDAHSSSINPIATPNGTCPSDEPRLLTECRSEENDHTYGSLIDPIATPEVLYEELIDIATTEQSEMNMLCGEFDPSKFLDKVPAKDTVGLNLPPWKRQIVARQLAEKAYKQDCIDKQQEAEEARFRNMPGWKRVLIEKKETENRIHQSEKKDPEKPTPLEARGVSSPDTPWLRNLTPNSNAQQFV